jgi:hypothetical protein
MTNREHRALMPTKKEISDYWGIPDDMCWGCGFDLQLERCHLLARWNGGTFKCDNLVLLCKFCHNHLQEYWSNSKEKAEFIKEKIIDGAPFMQIRIQFELSKYNLQLEYDLTIT